MTANSQPTSKTTLVLGYSGLIPFVVLSCWLAMSETNAGEVTHILRFYAFGIFSFMCGAWWLAEASQGHERIKRILSNVFFLVAFFIGAFFERWSFLTLALLFVGLFFVEFYSPLFRPFDAGYRLMRKCLTAVVFVSLLVSHFSVLPM